MNDDLDENAFGDAFIREARISREQHTRLKYIDSQLETMRSASRATVDSNGDATSVSD